MKLHSEYANADSLQLIEKKIKKYTSVSDLLYRKDMMQMVNDNVKRVSLILLTLAVMLMAISFVLISNTIRLLIYSKRFLIHTMKLVGLHLVLSEGRLCGTMWSVVFLRPFSQY